MAQCPGMLVQLPPRCTQCNRNPNFFFKNMRGQPQISSPSLGGVGVDLGLDSLTMSGLVPDKFNSKRNLAGCVASWCACAVSPWVPKNDHKGLRAAIRPSPSAIQRSDTICGAAKTVSLPTGRDSLPAQKRSNKQSPSRGGKCRLLQPLLPRTQKRRELSANIRSTCVKQSTHAATVQNVDPTQACAVYKAKRLVYHDRPKRRLFPHSDPPQTSEISEVCIRRNSVPIQRTPIR